MTAIAANGITVYSGASSSSGARVVMNSVGLAGYNSSGTATFSITASTGAAVFSGSVTGATITGGTLNIAGNAIINSSGLLTATGATITGAINATSGYFGTLTNGFSISSTGLVGVGTGTIVGGIISGAQFTNGSTFSVSPTGYLLASDVNLTGTIKATSGYIGSATTGWNFTSSGYFYNSGSTTILYPTTSPGGNANTYAFYTDRGYYGNQFYCSSTTAASIFSLGGLSVDGQVRGAAGAFIVNSSGNITTVGNITQSGTLTGNTGITSTGAISTSGNISTTSSGTITGAGNITASAYLINSGIAIQNGTAVHILTGGRLVQSTSSERFKKNIVSIPEGGWLNKVLQIRPVNFQYDEAYSEAPDEVISGLIAEDIAEIPGFEHLIYNDPLGDPFSLSYERLTVFLVMAIKELKAEIDTLKGE
jgi:hypothetical protein